MRESPIPSALSQGGTLTDLETRAMRDPRLRKHDAVVVLLFVAPSLNHATPSFVKVSTTAAGLDMERRKVRHALRLLVSLGYLVVAEAAGKGTAGTYMLPAAHRSETRLAAYL